MSNGVYFILATLALVVGYVVYGTFVAKVFGENSKRLPPAVTKADGVDYVVMPVWKVWLIQLLNIAGVGPVFGPILGALYGPVALLWIVIGSIFAGAVHDYISGMLSIRYGGCNLPTIVGNTLGNVAKNLMRLFAVILLVLVGVVFAKAPAGLLAKMTPDISVTMWLFVIFGYYFIATIMPIDKIIGRIYPLFGAVLLIMAFGMTFMMFVSPDLTFYNSCEWTNQHPKHLPLFPLVFITIACGALSGFHSTQSPLMARCLGNERYGKHVFYGGMIAEGFIGLVWATVGMSFYHGPEALAAALQTGGGPAAVVHESAFALMGPFGGVLAVLGVVVLPITSGDTAFRAARLTIAEVFNFSQKPIPSRLWLAVPLFAVGIVLCQVGFNTIWNYFGWSNQSLACIVLWAGAVYLASHKRLHWICTIPALFMTAVCVSFICYSPNLGFGMPITIANVLGVGAAIVAFAIFMLFASKVVVAPEDEAVVDNTK